MSHGETHFPHLNIWAIRSRTQEWSRGSRVFHAAIPGIALHGVDQPVLHLFYDADVVGQAVALPIEKDNIIMGFMKGAFSMDHVFMIITW